jgi:hypothetical protein
MPASPPRYRKLPGRAAGLATYTTLYLGPDHLLQVTSSGLSETYKRFYFRDIQGFVMGRTNSGTTTSIVAAGLTGLSLLLTLFFALPGGDVAGVIAFGVVTGILGTVFLANLAFGPTCRCRVHTAVQTEKLPSLNRVPRALKLIRQIQPMIESAQASIASSLQSQPVGASFASTVSENPSSASSPVAEARGETPII